MALIRCAECTAKISNKASACPKCGAPVAISKKKQKKQISTGCGCLLVLIIGGIIAAVISSKVSDPTSTPPSRSTTSKKKPATPVPEHQIVSTKDVSYSTVVRKSYRVRVPREMTKDELTAISQHIVRQATAKRRINAIMIFFFLPDSDTTGYFTAGKATWAPAGDWAKASGSLPPKLIVEAGGLMGTISKEDVVNLPIGKKKDIFMQIGRFQDRGMDPKPSYAAAAKQFGITTKEARKIALEGAARGWPMPDVEE